MEKMFSDWDISEAWAGFKFPAAETVLESQRKSFKALSLANKATVEGWQTVARKQAEYWMETVEKTRAHFQDMASLSEPEDRIAKQAAFTKTVFEDGLSRARENQVLATQAADTAIGIMSERWTEGMDEALAFASQAAEMKVPATKAGPAE